MSGSIRLEAPDPGWLEIPEALAPDESAAWVDAVTEWMRGAWGQGWDERAEASVPTMLRDSLTERPDANYVFEVWPIFRPVRLRVQISVVDPATLPDWAAEEFSVVGYDDAPIGPGIQCVRMTDVGGDFPATVVDWCAVFSDDTLAVTVLVEPTPIELLTMALPGLHAMIASLEVGLPSGQPSHALPTEYAIVGDDVTWTGLRLREAGLLPEGIATDDDGARS